MFTDPIKNLKSFGLKEDNIVADLGAGTGFYSIALGHIATKGKVYAVDIDKDFLATIKNKARDARLNNVEILWGNVEKLGGTSIGDRVVDAVVASNILFQLEDKEKFVLEIQRILKQKGRLLLIDWSAVSPVMGAKRVFPKEKALDLFKKKGFILEREIPTGAHHYGIILIKS